MPKATATEDTVEADVAVEEPAVAGEVIGEGVDQWTPEVPPPAPEGRVRVRANVGIMDLTAGQTGEVADSDELRACAERGLVDVLE